MARLMICTPDGGVHGIPLGGGAPVALSDERGTWISTPGEDGNVVVRAIVHDLPWYVVVDPPLAEGSVEEDASERPSKPGETY